MPESGKAFLARGFLELKQGKSSVSDYVSSFESLSKYGLEFIGTPYKKNLKFVFGHKKYLKKSLMLQLKLSFEELVDSALHLEAVEKERDSSDEAEVRKNPHKMTFPFQRSQSFPPRKKEKQDGSSFHPYASPSSIRVLACFNCGSRDHLARE